MSWESLGRENGGEKLVFSNTTCDSQPKPEEEGEMLMSFVFWLVGLFFYVSDFSFIEHILVSLHWSTNSTKTAKELRVSLSCFVPSTLKGRIP